MQSSARAFTSTPGCWEVGLTSIMFLQGQTLTPRLSECHCFLLCLAILGKQPLLSSFTTPGATSVPCRGLCLSSEAQMGPLHAQGQQEALQKSWSRLHRCPKARSRSSIFCRAGWWHGRTACMASLRAALSPASNQHLPCLHTRHSTDDFLSLCV